MLRLTTFVAIVAVMALSAIGCRFTKTAPPVITIEALLATPEKLQVEGRTYTIAAHLWRDFMPMTPPAGSPLMAVIKITAHDGLEFPPGLNADRLWVIKDRKELWETDFTGENRGTEPNQLEKSAGDGPKWESGIEVEAVVRLVSVKDGKTYLLRAAKQKITRTE